MGRPLETPAVAVMDLQTDAALMGVGSVYFALPMGGSLSCLCTPHVEHIQAQ